MEVPQQVSFQTVLLYLNGAYFFIHHSSTPVEGRTVVLWNRAFLSRAW